MSNESNFAELIQQVRQGDQEAATRLVKEYEPMIRRSVRLRIGDTRLKSTFDSMDICQSVFASFFVRAASGQYELDTASDLLNLLTRMAQNKLVMQVRKQRSQKRDVRRMAGKPANELDIPEGTSTPSAQLAAREMLELVQKQFSPEERELVELRNQGLGWGEIADRLQASPDGLRMKLNRAIDRVADELNLDEELGE